MLYRFFTMAAESVEMVDRLRAAVRPMSERQLQYFFVELGDLLERASPAQRRHLQACYPECDFDRMFLTASIRC